MALRIGVAQIENRTDYSENRNAIEKSLWLHADRGADLVLFPECATTGFHRGLLQIDSSALARSIDKIRETAHAAKITVVLPTPYPCRHLPVKFTNSVLVIDAAGEVSARFDKGHFAGGEDRLFVPGSRESRTFSIRNHRIGVLICIEASQAPWDHLDPMDLPDVVLWPGFYGTIPGETWSDGTDPQSIAVRKNIEEAWKVPLFRATHATNPESHRWPHKIFGGSIAVDGSARAVHRARFEREDHFQLEVYGGEILSAR